MNMNRRAFLTAAVVLPVAGLAVVSRLGQEKPLVTTREDFAREARLAWDNARDFNTETMRYKSRNTWHAPEGEYEYYNRVSQTRARALAESIVEHRRRILA